ncbi:SH3 domain-containing protein [Rhodosalinus sp.]|uniref:SH3 domain-containing protein n=1 Tax=Rhodosalinus sp. TaxID=2047741 RepID=UPI003978C027
MRFALLAAAAVCGLSASPLEAQTADEFFQAFSGDWYVFDPQRSETDQTCRIDLGTEGEGDSRDAATRGCRMPLSAVVSWTISDGQLSLRNEAGEQVLQLGGNQQRITGEFSDTGQGVVLERPSGDGTSGAIAEALRRHGCFFLGYSADCAPREVLERPTLTDDGGQVGSIETLVNLNVRSQPRRDAPELGTVPEETCVRVNDCLVASDGVWCRARFGDQTGWLAKTALRQEEWPVITYENGCTEDGEGEGEGS